MLPDLTVQNTIINYRAYIAQRNNYVFKNMHTLYVATWLLQEKAELHV